MRATGSTTIKSAAFVAVDRAMPQWARTSEPMTSLASASVAGGTLASVTRVATYDVA